MEACSEDSNQNFTHHNCFALIPEFLIFSNQKDMRGLIRRKHDKNFKDIFFNNSGSNSVLCGV